MLVQKICEVPDNIFSPLVNLLPNINWSEVFRSNRDIIYHDNSNKIYSNTINLRKQDPGKLVPRNFEEWNDIITCMDINDIIEKYRCFYDASKWIMETVKGKSLGKVIITKVGPGGHIILHTDSGKYHERYSRFHIPIQTNLNVLFNGGPGTEKEHMPLKTLCRLNNSFPHSMTNDSEYERIHLIADVEVVDGNNTRIRIPPIAPWNKYIL